MQRCCNMFMALAVLQFVLGATITTLGLYTWILMPAIRVRETPYWAGIPLTVAGIFGIYYSGVEIDVYTGNRRAYCVKVIWCALSACCTFICVVAGVFPAVHAAAFHVSYCSIVADNCLCYVKVKDIFGEDLRRGHYLRAYTDACDQIPLLLFCIAITQSVLCVLASLICLWVAMGLWNRRYGNFYSGLRFYSYNAHVPRPERNPSYRMMVSDHENQPPSGKLVDKQTNTGASLI